MFEASKISRESLPFVDQNKKAAKLPEIILEILCPFTALRCLLFFLNGS